MSSVIKYYFSVGSPWAYLGLEPLKALSDKFGIKVIPAPTNIIEQNGGVFLKDRPAHRKAYWLADLARWSQLRGKDLLLANRQDLANPLPAASMIIAAILDGQDWWTLTQALQSAFWEEKKDIGQLEVRVAVAIQAGFDGLALAQRESSADVLSRWQTDLEAATQGGVFGSPTYIYENELFWGQDSLQFLEIRLEQKQSRAI